MKERNMTYEDLIDAIRDHADFLERTVQDSQIVTLKTEIGDGFDAESDMVVMEYTSMVEELMANITGHHNWSVVKVKN
jgi:hypothetical protein